MDESAITTSGAVDTFLVLLIGIGPKLALVPFLEITAALDETTKRQVRRKMLITAATVALALIVLGELLRTLLHFSVASLSIAGGVILLVLAVWMVLVFWSSAHRPDPGCRRDRRVMAGMRVTLKSPLGG